MSRKPDNYLGLLLATALLIRLYFIAAFDYISPDGVQYVRIGYNIWHGFAYSSGGAMFPDIIQPPFYPFVSGFFSLLFNPLLAGKIASLLAGLLLIVVTYRFLLRLSGKGVALAGAALTAFHPGLIAVSAQAASEAWYLLFVALLVYDGWHFINEPSRAGAGRLALWFSLGFLTRPEMLVVVLFLLAVFTGLVLFARKKIPFKYGMGFLLPSLAVVMLYGFSVSTVLGYFTVSPKINFVRIQSKLAAIVRAEDPAFKQLPPKVAAYRSFYRIDPGGRELLSHALLYKKRAAMFWLDEHRPRNGGGFSAVRMLTGMGLNAKKMIGKVLGGKGLPWIWALLGFTGLYVLFRRQKELAVYLFFMMLPLSMYLLVHIEDRFLLGAWPMLALPAALTTHLVYGKMASRFSPAVSMVLVGAVLLAASTTAYKKMYGDFQGTNRWKQLSREIEETVEPGTRMMARQPQTVFFLNLEYRLLPFGSIDKLLVYSQKQKIDYLFLDESDLTLNPELAKFLEPSTERPFVLVKNGSVAGKSYWLFHIK